MNISYFHINYRFVNQEGEFLLHNGRMYQPIGLELATGNFICLLDIDKEHQYLLKNK